MLISFKDPGVAGRNIILSALGILALGTLGSYKDLAVLKAKADGAERALNRAETCLIKEGVLMEGEYLVTRDTQGTKTVETLLADGVTVCDVGRGNTAQALNGVASYYRRGNPGDIKTSLANRLGVDEQGNLIIPEEMKVYSSRAWKANPAQRKKQTPVKKGWLGL
jgi:hypothetical protein